MESHLLHLLALHWEVSFLDGLSLFKKDPSLLFLISAQHCFLFVRWITSPEFTIFNKHIITQNAFIYSSDFVTSLEIILLLLCVLHKVVNKSIYFTLRELKFLLSKKSLCSSPSSVTIHQMACTLWWWLFNHSPWRLNRSYANPGLRYPTGISVKERSKMQIFIICKILAGGSWIFTFQRVLQIDTIQFPHKNTLGILYYI